MHVCVSIHRVNITGLEESRRTRCFARSSKRQPPHCTKVVGYRRSGIRVELKGRCTTPYHHSAGYIAHLKRAALKACSLCDVESILYLKWERVGVLSRDLKSENKCRSSWRPPLLLLGAGRRTEHVSCLRLRIFRTPGYTSSESAPPMTSMVPLLLSNGRYTRPDDGEAEPSRCITLHQHWKHADAVDRDDISRALP